MTRARAVVGGVAVLLLMACTGDTAGDAPVAETISAETSTTATPSAEASTTDTPSAEAPVRPDLPTVTVTMTTPDGRVCELCVWRASTAEQRSRGLMGVTDLGDVDGMVFTYGTPSAGAFWMRSTPRPLTISFHDDGGEQVGLHEMEPCPDDVAPAACPRYSASTAYVLALEVPTEHAAELGVVPGARAALGGPCTPG